MKSNFLLFIFVLCSTLVFGEINRVQIKSVGVIVTANTPADEKGIALELDAVPSPGNLILAIAGARTGDATLFTPADAGFTKLVDVINSSGGRLHVFYKYAGENESKRVKLNAGPTSQFTLIVAEYANVKEVSAGNPLIQIQQTGVEELTIGSIEANAGDIVIAAVAARELTTTAVNWSNNFTQISGVSANLEIFPITSVVAEFVANSAGSVSTKASWTGSCQPSGTLISLKSSTTNNLNSTNMDRFKVYPNPTKREINVSFDNEAPLNISIYTINGKLVASKNNASGVTKINIEHLQPGLYLLKGVDRNGKILKTKFTIL
jgi:hypothetical protein